MLKFLLLEEYGRREYCNYFSATYVIQRSHVGSRAEQDLSVLDVAPKRSVVKRGEILEVPWIGKV